MHVKMSGPPVTPGRQHPLLVEIGFVTEVPSYARKLVTGFEGRHIMAVERTPSILDGKGYAMTESTVIRSGRPSEFRRIRSPM